MKEIMFRVWDERNHVMFAADDVYRCLRFGNSIAPPNNNFTVAIEREEIIEAMIEGKGRLRLLQYTGLKDQNKVEIYEGDILLCDDYDIFPLEYDAAADDYRPSGRYEVIWDEDAAGFTLRDAPEMEYNPLSYLGAEGSMEVIGNIYEHPELLDREGER